MPHLWTFIKRFFNDWLTLLSGVPSLATTILAFYVSTEAQKTAFAVSAVLLWLFTTYRVWVREYESLLAEQVKPSTPELVCRITELHLAHYLSADDELATHPSEYDVVDTYFAVRAIVVNRRNATVSMADIELDIQVGDQWYPLTSISMEGLVVVQQVYRPNGISTQSQEAAIEISDLRMDARPLVLGQHHEGWIGALAHSWSINEDQIQAMGITVTDAFGVKHRNIYCPPWQHSGKVKWSISRG